MLNRSCFIENYQIVEIALDLRKFSSLVTRGACSIIDVADIILSAGSLFTDSSKLTTKPDSIDEVTGRNIFYEYYARGDKYPEGRIIKTIDGRKWYKEEKYWELPNTEKTFTILKKHYYKNLQLDFSSYLSKLKKELASRDYAQNTEKNYSLAVNSFLNYQKSFPTKRDTNTIKAYFRFLKNKKKLN